MQRKFGPSNIRVNAVAPGIIDTDMNRELTKEEIEEIKDEVILKRIGNPKDVANCAYMLALHEYITGETIKVDGGWID